MKCDICGRELEPRSGRGAKRKRCPACAKVLTGMVSRIAARERYQGIPNTSERKAARFEEAKALARAKVAAAQKERGGRCPYCGRLTKAEYCGECVRNGYDHLHQFTGRSNGWDKRAKADDVSVADGWRGRPVAGGGRSDVSFWWRGEDSF